MSLAAKVVAPETATLVREIVAELFEQVLENDTSTVVPVLSVTDGFVPGDPERVAVYDAEFVVPPAKVNAPTGVTHTHADPL